jgi:hypothetical protein
MCTSCAFYLAHIVVPKAEERIEEEDVGSRLSSEVLGNVAISVDIEYPHVSVSHSIFVLFFSIRYRKWQRQSQR